MWFDTPLFLLAFFPAVLICFIGAQRWRPDFAAPLLLGASLAFYALTDLPMLPLLLLSLTINYLISGILFLGTSHHSAWTMLGVAAALLPLLFYKLGGAAYVPASAGGIFLTAGIPLGLSFYTFQQITCLFDIRRKVAIRLGFPDHALFVAFFAQIPSGPISRYRDLSPQIAGLGRAPVSAVGICAGISLILFGLAKKVFIADSIGGSVDAIYGIVVQGKGLNFWEAWASLWGFVLQLYFDFSGYSDIAIGIGLCFGLRLPVNFNSPLKAASLSALLDRWHMSLIAFVREYLYEPVFRIVRKTPLKSGTSRRLLAWVVATITSLAAVGAWHGSRIAYPLLGGIAFGILLVLTQLPALILPRRPQLWSGLELPSRLLSRALVLLPLSVAAITYRTRSLSDMLNILCGMANFRSICPSGYLAALQPATILPALPLLLGTLLVFSAPNTMEIFGLLPQASATMPRWMAWRPTVVWGAIVGGVAILDVVFWGYSANRAFFYAHF